MNKFSPSISSISSKSIRGCRSSYSSLSVNANATVKKNLDVHSPSFQTLLHAARGRGLSSVSCWRKFATAAEAKRKPTYSEQPYAANNKIFMGVIGFGLLTVGIIYVYKTNFDPKLNHPAMLEALELINKSPMFSGREGDIDIKGWGTSIESQKPFVSRFRIDTTRGHAAVTVKAKIIAVPKEEGQAAQSDEEEVWMVTNVVIDFPTTLDRFIYDAKTQTFLKDAIKLSDVSVSDFVTTTYENTYTTAKETVVSTGTTITSMDSDDWTSSIKQTWTETTLLRKTIAGLVILIPLSLLYWLHRQKAPKICQNVSAFCINNEHLIAALGENIQQVPGYKGKIGKKLGNFELQFNGADRKGVLRVQANCLDGEWKVTDARLNVEGSRRNRKIPIVLD